MQQKTYTMWVYTMSDSTISIQVNISGTKKTTSSAKPMKYKLLTVICHSKSLKEVDGAFRSFFGLIRKAQNKNYDPRAVKLPKYLEKESFFTLVIGFVRISNNELLIPYSSSYRKDHKSINIKIPPVLHDKTIKEIRIVLNTTQGSLKSSIPTRLLRFKGNLTIQKHLRLTWVWTTWQLVSLMKAGLLLLTVRS